ncbi:MAG: T9SS type A sorting domain-containing protein [Flavobacteriales bacterium]|nr:T9SS type A sorting domain-containing protein [Flavobacteriales bacterium]
MKKHLLIILSLFGSVGAMAQSCTIDPQFATQSPGLYPQGPLGPSCELLAAKTIVSLTDTLIDTGILGVVTAYIDQLKVDSVYGLPAGLQLHTNIETAPPPYNWGTYLNTGTVPNQTSATGCAYISGMQSAWDAAIDGGTGPNGVYPLVFVIDARIHSTTNPTANAVIGTPAWVSSISPNFGGGRFYILDTLVVASDYLALDATISGTSNVDPATQYNYSVTAVPGATYSWTVTNGTVMSGAGTASVMVQFNGSGSVEVAVTDNSCSGNDVMAVTANPTGIDEAAGINVSIYPNPSNGIFTLQLEGTDALNIRIMDVSGKVVRAERLAGANLYTIDMTAAEAGVYVMEIETAQGRTFKRLVRN